MIDRIVDRLVIRDGDPRDPGWMKGRAVLVGIFPGVLLLGAFELLGLRGVFPTLLVIWVVLVSVKLVARPINERIEELETADENEVTQV